MKIHPSITNTFHVYRIDNLSDDIENDKKKWNNKLARKIDQYHA